MSPEKSGDFFDLEQISYYRTCVNTKVNMYNTAYVYEHKSA